MDDILVNTSKKCKQQRKKVKYKKQKVKISGKSMKPMKIYWKSIEDLLKSVKILKIL